MYVGISYIMMYKFYIDELNENICLFEGKISILLYLFVTEQARYNSSVFIKIKLCLNKNNFDHFDSSLKVYKTDLHNKSL